MKQIVWSFSSMKDFQGCPRRYHEIKVLKNYPFVDTIHTIHGKAVHSAIEDYLNDGVCLPDAYDSFRPTIEKINAIDGEKYVEIKMGVTRELEPCGFSDAGVWAHGIADLCIISSRANKAIVIDWKTGGKNYPDTKQLELMFLLFSARHPEIQEFDCHLMFLEHGVKVSEHYEACDSDRHWQYWRDEYAKFEAAFDRKEFRPKKHALCGWCPVVTCEHHYVAKPKKAKA